MEYFFTLRVTGIFIQEQLTIEINTPVQFQQRYVVDVGGSVIKSMGYCLHDAILLRTGRAIRSLAVGIRSYIVFAQSQSPNQNQSKSKS